MAQVVFYCQHLTEIGHHVRSREIVRALARRHDVTFVVGGRPVPGGLDPETFKIVQLSPIFRGADGMMPCDPGSDLRSVLAERRHQVQETIRLLQPDLLIIEHFPFSKWELGAEIMPAVDLARSVNTPGKVVCSLRDVAKTSRFDPTAGPESGDAAHRIRSSADVVRVLERSFDAVLVHADPTVTRVESQIDWASDITIPIVYTGYVSQKLDRTGWTDRGARPAGDFVMVSAGGGAEALEIAGPCIEAWRLCRRRNWVGDRELVIFTGPYVDPERLRVLEQMGDDATIHLRESTDHLLAWMDAADLSVSRAGYNTCMNVLETGTRAIVIPSPVMSDQMLRARKLSERGVVAMIDPGTATPERIAEAIRDGVSRPTPRHDLDLDGAAKTLAYVDELDRGTL